MIGKNLAQRIAVALVGIPALLWITRQSGWWLQGLVMVIVALGAYEYLSQINTKKFSNSIRITLALLWVSTLVIAGAHMFFSPQAAALSYLFFLLPLGMSLSLRPEAPDRLFQFMHESGWGLFYLSLLYPFLYHVREIDPINGFNWILTLLIAIWVGDTAAMALGKAFGKRKLAPTVSPNKTIFGFVSGLVTSALIGLAAGLWLFEGDIVLFVTGGAIVISLFGQLGDLVESMWKRTVGIKDSSALIPGHGGVLDRFDSLAFAAPALYLYLHLSAKLGFS